MAAKLAVIKGQTASLNCSVNNHFKSTTTFWTREENSVQIAVAELSRTMDGVSADLFDKRLSGRFEFTNTSIAIRETTMEDAGIYACKMYDSSSHGLIGTRQIDMNVYESTVPTDVVEVPSMSAAAIGMIASGVLSVVILIVVAIVYIRRYSSSKNANRGNENRETRIEQTENTEVKGCDGSRVAMEIGPFFHYNYPAYVLHFTSRLLYKHVMKTEGIDCLLKQSMKIEGADYSVILALRIC